MGAGASGSELAKRLVDDGYDVVVIDKNINTLKSVTNKIDCLAIQNEGNNFEAIKNADVSNANFFFALTSQDEVNMLACKFASNENSELITIAGVRDYSYSFLIENQKELLGIDYIVNAQLEAAKYAITSIEYGIVGNPVNFGIEGFALRENKIRYKSLMCGKSVQEIRNTWGIDFVIASIYKNKEYVIPKGDAVIDDGDVVYFFAHNDVLDDIFETDTTSKDIKRILIYGATDMGLYIAEYLEKNLPRNGFLSKKNIVVMDRNHDNCISAAEKLPNILIVEDSLTEHDSLSSHFSDYDICVCATDNQELNLISALHAKNIGIKRSLAIVKEKAYMKMATDINIDSTISSLNSSVDKFIHIINSKNVKSVHSILSGEMEVVEFSISNESKMKNKIIKDIKLPKSVLVLFIARNEKIFIPTGAFKLLENDIFACIGTRDSIKTLQDFF